MTYKTYEFTAFSEAGLQDSGALSGDLRCGSTFTMPQYADVCISVTDNDPYLSGDSCYNENADDHYGQHASIEGADGEIGNGGQIYAEQYFWVQDQYGNYFLLIEIEQEGGSGDYFTFHQSYGMPSAGAELTVTSACNVNSNWIDYKCLDGGDKPPATGTISGTVWCDVDCDGLQDACVLETKGENLIKNGDFEHNPLYSHQGWGTFSSIEGWYAGSGHIEIMEGRHWGINNEYGNAVLELDANYNSTVCQQVHVETAGTYCLTLDYQMRGHDTSTNGFEVYVNGVLVETVHPTQEGVFEELELSFDLPAGTARIDLKAIGKSDCIGTVIDNVELRQVIEQPVGEALDINVSDFKATWDSSSQHVAVDICNNSDKTLELAWIDYHGNLVTYATIEPGQAKHQGTYTTHNWVLIDKDSGDIIALLEDPFDGQKVTIGGNSEPVKEGVTVKLIDGDTGAVLDTTTTDEDGNYEFDDLPAGNYKIMGVAPNGQEFTLQDVGNDDSIDSDVDGNGMSGMITLGAGDEVDIDLGLKEKKLGEIGGRYFCDENDNDRDDGEPGVAGKTVWLLKDGVQIASTTTDSNGDYCFEDLEEGNYSVVFEADEKPFVGADVGDDEDDSDVVDTDGDGNGVTADISLAAGESKKNVDAGVEPLGSLSGRYFCDTDGDAQDNNNGDEPGVAGIQVMLLDANGNPTGRTTVTDAQGNYAFLGLIAGTYGVKFTDPDNVTDGKVLIQANVGDDASDSDAIGDATESVIEGIVVVSGADTPDNDAGIEDGNQPPTPVDDTAMGCADTVIMADVLANDGDPDGDTFEITMVDGQDISEGETITTAAGTNVTLEGGVLKIDGEDAYAALDIGESASEDISYKITDSAGNSASANLELTIKGDANSLESLVASLPSSTKYQVAAGNELDPIEDFGYDVLLSESGDARLDGVVFDQAYCLSFEEAVATDGSFLTAPTLMGDILDGKDGSAFLDTQVGLKNGLAAAENLDLINWIINEEFHINSAGSTDGQFSDWEIQLAIWELTDTLDPQFWGTDSAADFVLGLDPAYGQREDVDYILTEAMNNGEGFMAGDGDIATFIVDPNPPTAENSQPFIMGFRYDDFDCIC